MSVAWEDSYMGQLRKLVGHGMLIAPGVRAVIQNQEGRTLLVRRSDNGAWVMPAGGLEPGESMMDCLVREVREETGLQVMRARPFALYSEPRFESVNMYGDAVKMLAVAFWVEEWEGELAARTDETTDARFVAADDMFDGVPALYRETLTDFAAFQDTGQFVLK